MKSIITFEERYAMEKERRRTKPFSAAMQVRFEQVCPFCFETMCHYHKCSNPKAPEGVNRMMPAERVIISYR